MLEDFSWQVADVAYKTQVFILIRLKRTFPFFFLMSHTLFLELLSTFDLCRKSCLPETEQENKTQKKRYKFRQIILTYQILQGPILWMPASTAKEINCVKQERTKVYISYSVEFGSSSKNQWYSIAYVWYTRTLIFRENSVVHFNCPSEKHAIRILIFFFLFCFSVFLF